MAIMHPGGLAFFANVAACSCVPITNGGAAGKQKPWPIRPATLRSSSHFLWMVAARRSTVSNPITLDDIKKFAAAWYLALDQHVPIEESYKFLTDAGLNMQFPDGDIRNFDSFKQWYDRVTSLFFDENHTVQSVEATISGDRAEV